MNKLLISSVCILLFSILFVNFGYADETSSEPEIAIPDLVIDFNNDKNWHGLKSGETPYWKIEDGVGKFNIQPGTLEPGKRQLESASIDLENLLGERIGEDWVLRYKLTIDEFKMGSDSSWSQLLIGLFSKPTSGTASDITHGDAKQWGLGTAFMTGVDMKRTMLMYDLGFYLEWHSQPEKGSFENEKSLPGENKTYWVEYRKMKNFLTVSIFDDSSFERETLVEKQHTEGWANVDDLKYFRLFPLIETNTSDGVITGTIDDIEFYNNKRYVTKNFDEKELEEIKSFEERLNELFDKQNQSNIDKENKRLEKLKRESIPEWLKFPAGLWSDSKLSNKQFFQIVEYLIKQDILAIPLSNYELFDDTYKPQTITLPSEPECTNCVETKLINLRWVLPEELAKKGSNPQILIKNPSNEVTSLSATSDDSISYEITNEFVPGIYDVDIIFANEKFSAPSFLLLETEIPKLPFWIKDDAKKWSLDKKPIQKFKDILDFLIKEKFIDIEPSEFIVPESIPPLTQKQILLTYFPTDDEKNAFEPFTWKYFEDYSRGIFQYRAQESMSIQTSVGKILYDISRPYDPIYNKNQVPYILMELYQYESNENAKSFVDKYPRVYNAFFDQSDMSGTSDSTGDCMYNNQKNFVESSMDEIHMVICIYEDLALLITVYEDYPNVNSSLVFNIADIMFEKIHNGNESPKLHKILKQNSFEVQPESKTESSQEQNNPPSQNDSELSGTKLGIQNFTCIKDDFGMIEINGEFTNSEKFFEKIVFSIILKSYDGTKLAQGDSEILDIEPFEIRKFDGYVELNEPFYECSAVINWDKSK
ncbi:hypothetical protein A7X95_01275 [Candidatus Nitrosopelagicus brevis]|uniref:Uncharacterized protein n=1 Tax=Candidatus Nitrosopelagicus brevis TaxID=1410606 RepID=A0A0A7UYE7_9ARCH|nr:hypothetical protein [Candidatus Nitrosopelagicus brevis]AJA91834.1 hypothetical protein T478_0680 [Candidatus Nitrosopelagicus brevis]PTL87939.1 hypothetical protein A7X95_01275 [Candidatus Nitrosopelagicus brevis]